MNLGNLLNVVLRLMCAGALSAASLTAQTASTAALRGRVVEALDTLRPINLVEVELVGAGLRRIADANGLYRFDDTPAGDFELVVRRIGYKSERRRVVLRAGETTVADFHVARVTQTLSEVTVEGRRLKVPVRYGEVYDRAARGWGKFFTREDIQARNPQDVKALLASIPTVLINNRGITFQRCQAGLPSPFSSAAQSVNKNSIMDESQAADQRPGNVQVYIDGVRMTRNNRGPDVPREFQALTEADQAMELVPPSSIQAIEVYTGITRIPAQFATDACAAIVIWTTSY